MEEVQLVDNMEQDLDLWPAEHDDENNIASQVHGVSLTETGPEIQHSDHPTRSHDLSNSLSSSN